jgi:transposase
MRVSMCALRVLMTVPGFGYYLALLVKAEIGDVSRFRSGDHLCSYAGIVPSTYSSGGVARHGRITREGSRWLRLAVFEAATTHIKYDTAITRAYHRIAERGSRKVALVATARRLLPCRYSVLKNRKPYFFSGRERQAEASAHFALASGGRFVTI